MNEATTDTHFAAATPTASEVVSLFRRAPARYVDVGHSRLAYYRAGHGPDVVFVHGWPLHSATFRKITPRLAERFTCHFFDLPGTGKTESKPDAPIGLAEHAESLRVALDVLKLSSYALVAHDSGGAIARLLAADNARVRALVLGNTEIPGHEPLMIKLYSKLARTPGANTLLRLAMMSSSVRRSAIGFGGCFGDLDCLEGEFDEFFVRPLLASSKSFADQTRLLANLDHELVNDLAAVHARITAPALLVWGTDDPFFPLAKARAMLSQFGGGAELTEIAGAKLFAHEDRADEFAARVRSFLDRVLRAS